MNMEYKDCLRLVLVARAIPQNKTSDHKPGLCQPVYFMSFTVRAAGMLAFPFSANSYSCFSTQQPAEEQL
jgi:hypothetical protein